MRQTVPLRDGILPSAAGTVVWSFVIVLLLAAGSPPLQACDGGTAVPDPESNPGLVADCKVLLEIRDKLDGPGPSTWDTGLAITEWEGINVSGSPSRVTILDVVGNGLTGEIPAEIGRLTQLRELYLARNQLTGEIPTELGRLSQLLRLRPGMVRCGRGRHGISEGLSRPPVPAHRGRLPIRPARVSVRQAELVALAGAYPGIDHLLERLEYPLAQLARYFSETGQGRLNANVAETVAAVLQNVMSALKEMAHELDDEYAAFL